MKFSTGYQYKDRYTKARYVYLKYQSILVGNILKMLEPRLMLFEGLNFGGG